MASADVDMDIQEEDVPLQTGRRPPPPTPCLVRYYQASEMLPEKKGHLHNLMQKQPAVLGVRLTKAAQLYETHTVQLCL